MARVHEPNEDDFTELNDKDKEGTDDTNELSPEDQIKRLNNESKKHRLRAKEERRRADAAEAKLAQAGESAPTSGPSREEIVIELVEAGLTKGRIRAAMKLVEWDSVEDADDAIEQLREDHPFLFEQPKEQDKEPLAKQGSAHNARKGKIQGTSDQDLYRRYPALGHGR